MKTTVTMEFGPEESVEDWFSEIENDRLVHRALTRFSHILKKELADAKEAKDRKKADIYDAVINQLCDCLGKETARVKIDY